MKPRLRHFTWTNHHDNDSGLSGWLMRGFESLEPTQGFGVAHDVLEHHSLALGMDAEAKAFGSILYGRWDRDGIKLSHRLAQDVAGFIADGSGWCTPVKRYTTLEDYSDYYEVAIAKFSDGLFDLVRNDDDPHDPVLRQQIKDFCEWMRRGLRETEKVWRPHYGQTAFLTAFDDLTRVVETIGRAEEGDRLKVRIDACGGVQVRHCSADGYEY